MDPAVADFRDGSPYGVDFLLMKALEVVALLCIVGSVRRCFGFFEPYDDLLRAGCDVDGVHGFGPELMSLVGGLWPPLFLSHRRFAMSTADVVSERVDPETGEVLEGRGDVAVVDKRGRVRITIAEYAAKLARKFQLPTGEEIPDPTPMAPPIGWRKEKSMVEIIREQIRSAQLAAEAEAAGMETFEESDDFDVPDELEPFSAYEMEEVFEPVRPAEPLRAAPKADEPPPAPGPAEPPTGA